jgi:voltage-gated sodium channel
MERISSSCARAVDSWWFTAIVFTAILVNAAALGAETYAGIATQYGGLLTLVNHVCLGIFTVELAVRLLAYAPRFREFFRSGWNVFDFVVIGASYVPFLGDSATILRLVRLARIVRIVSLFPDLRILLVAIGRSVPPILSMCVMALLMIYVYAIVGWMLFGQALPDRWGDVGTAMLNLFVMLSLENFPDNLQAGMSVHPWSWIYFVSFALAASFILLNVLIGIVINSMEEARELEHQRVRAERRALILSAEADHRISPGEGLAMLTEKLESVRDALGELEEEIALVQGESPSGRG